MSMRRVAEERDQAYNEVVNMREAEERMPRPLREPLLRCPKIEVVIIISRSFREVATQEHCKDERSQCDNAPPTSRPPPTVCLAVQ